MIHHGSIYCITSHHYRSYNIGRSFREALETTTRTNSSRHDTLPINNARPLPACAHSPCWHVALLLHSSDYSTWCDMRDELQLTPSNCKRRSCCPDLDLHRARHRCHLHCSQTTHYIKITDRIPWYLNDLKSATPQAGGISDNVK